MLNLNHLKLIIVAYFLLALPLSAQNARLIDVTTLAQLNAMRYDLDGNGTPSGTAAEEAAYRTAFNLSTGVNNTCTGGTCQGYELTTNLNFSGSEWAEGGSATTGWMPIGDRRDPFTATFEGNGHTISNLYINTTTLVRVGLFGGLGINLKGTLDPGDDQVGEIRNLGIEGGNVTSTADGASVGSLVGFSSSGPISANYSTGDVTGGENAWVGGLVGSNSSGPISACYATGDVTGGNSAAVGGLVGFNDSTISACYATGSARGGTSAAVGGLVGSNFSGPISACYSTGSARGGTSANVGGLVGFNNSGTITTSYFDRETATLIVDGSELVLKVGIGSSSSSTDLAKTTSELQLPEDYTAIYSAWDVDIDNADADDDLTTGEDDHWDFVGHNRYPRLMVDFDGNGTPTAAEFGAQRFYFTKTDPGIEVFSLSVSDEAVAPTIIGYAKALSGTTTWALTDDNFEIDRSTGAISVKVAGATVATKMLSIEAMVESVTTELNLNVEVTDVIDTSPSPTITRFEDAAAGTITSALRGATVNIIGTNFSTTPANNTITVGGATATLTNATATVLTFTVPGAAAIGAGRIRVTVSGAANYVEAAFMITTTALPTIIRFEDAAGATLSPTATAAIGDIVKIIGTNFSTTPANNTITVGSATATPTNNATATELTFTVPLTATLGLGKIRVTVSGAGSPVETAFEVTAPPSPTITEFQDNVGNALSPTATAAIGDIVKIIGTNFSTTLVRNTITVGGATATPTNATATELTFTVPGAAAIGAGQIRVTVSGAENAAVLSFEVTAPPSPTISSFQDGSTNMITSALRGATVKIIGTNFSTTPANNTITVGGIEVIPTSPTATVLTFTVPGAAAIGAGQIRASVLGAANYVEAAFMITTTALPTIIRFEDAAGATLSPTATAVIGDIVKIIGTNFSTTPANNTITVGSATATPTNATATELTFTVPLTATLGLGKIRVTVSGAASHVEEAFTITAPPLAFAEASTSDTDVGFTGAMGAEKAKYVVTKTLDEVAAIGDVVLILNVAPSVTTAYAYVDMDGTLLAGPPTGLAATININGTISTDAALAVTSTARVFYVQATQGGNTVIAKVELSVKPIVFAAPSPVDADVAFTGAMGAEKAQYVVTKTLDEVDESGDVVLTLNVAPSGTTTYAYVDMDGTLLAGPPTGLAATINTNGTISTDAALAVTSSATVFYVQATQGANTVIAKVALSVKSIVFAAPDSPDADVAFTGVSGDTKAKYVVTKTLDEVDASGDVVLTLNVDPSGTTTYAYVDMDGADADAPTGLASTINTNGEITTDSTLAVTSMAAVFYVQATQAANFVIAKVELTVNAPALAFAAPAPTDADVAFTAVSGATKAKYVVTKTLDEVDESGDVVLTLNVDPSGTTAYAYVDMDGALTLTPPSRLVRPIPASGAISTTAALVVTSSAAVFYVQATQGGNTAIAKVELTVNAAATTDFLGLTNLAHDLVSLYPNPASDKVYVSGLKSGDVYIYEIYSFLGQKVGTGQLSEGPSIDLKGLSAGAYVLILRSESGEEVFRSRCLISK